MKKSVKRIVSILSALIIFSTFVLADANVAGPMDGVRAESPADPAAEAGEEKWGSNLDFNNPEQDTRTNADDRKVYNTNFGLHTDKTVFENEAYHDGRTFDINLESWYIGENPVDVGLILDASGSMAWTTKGLDALDVQKALTEVWSTLSPDDQGAITEKYGLTSDNITVADLNNIQDSNGGYLPEDIVELILDPKNTDYSKLGYNNYRYYIYEDRPSVSEFVPLGFWEGGQSSGDDELLIGHYPFDGTLENIAPNAAAEAAAKYIPFTGAEDGGFNVDGTVTETPFPVKHYQDGDIDDKNALDLAATAKKGALLLNDVSITGPFTIAMRVKTQEFEEKKNEYDELPLVYIGDMDCTNYIQLSRSSSSAKKLTVHDSGGSTTLISDNVFNDDPPSWINIILTFDGSKLWIYKNSSNRTKSGISVTGFTAEDLKIIIGGDIDGQDKSKGYADLGITDFCVFNSAITADNNKDLFGTLNSELNKDDNKLNSVTGLSDILTAYYSFDGGDLTNQVTPGTEPTYIGQTTGGPFSADALKDVPVDPVYNYGSDATSLDINETQKNGGAILLDAVPENLNDFTLSFKIKRTGGEISNNQNLFYIGDKNVSNSLFYSLYRSSLNGENLVLKPSKINGNSTSEETEGFTDPNKNELLYFQGGLTDPDVWYTITYVFGPGESDESKVKVTPYVNGKPATEDSAGQLGFPNEGDLNGDYNNPTDTNPWSPFEIIKEDLKLVIGALKNEDNGENGHFIDDVYVYNKALDASTVSNLFTPDEGNSNSDIYYMSHSDESGKSSDFAQMTSELNGNTYDARRGWYYVNSHSTWDDITGGLKGSKSYMGIINDTELSTDGKKNVATVPSSADGDLIEKITKGNDDSIAYDYTDAERSIRFYIDSQNCLRCFVNSGSKSSSERRTFCSLVYENPPIDESGHSEIKYETLNNALNNFFAQLKDKSNRSNRSTVSAVRFSLENLPKDNTDTEEDDYEEELKKLIMLKWKTMDALSAINQPDIVLPRYKNGDEFDSTGKSENDEYNYVLTGGTYTWTGLKAFYDNLVNEKSDDNNTKYLIIFTDGRDNLIGSSDEKDFYNKYAPAGIELDESNDSALAKAWADKIKDSGYTIFCVMMATGSVNKDHNPTTYQPASDFLASLAGSSSIKVDKEDVVDGNFNQFVFVSDPDNPETDSLNAQFEEILKNINVTLTGYTVQDYIDPRFDLVTYETAADDLKHEVLYKLGAGGKITRFDLNNQGPLGGGNDIGTAGNIIDDPKAAGIPYTTQDGKTADIYYDNVKDMYYLRWTDQTIGGGFEPFDTAVDGNYLNDEAWSSTITVRAKDDFIGGNDILTNGNEAGMNLVYDEEALKDVPSGLVRDELTRLSGTNNSVDRDTDGNKNTDVTMPSKGFPRTTANVRLLPVNTKDINDVIYLGEVVSPVMMLSEMLYESEDQKNSDLYYLEYLERYAYRLYGGDSGKEMPLKNLLNNAKTGEAEKKKTFTIPYIYLPDPEYEDNTNTGDGTRNVVINNNAGTAELNQRDIVGFITYTWQQEKGTAADQGNDIIKEFVVKDTNQIKYNLQMKFTPLKTGDLEGFTLDGNFIDNDHFFKVDDKGEFVTDTQWSFDNRQNLLKALVNDTTAETTTTTTTETTTTTTETTTESTTESTESTTTSSTTTTQSAKAADDSGSEPSVTYGPELFAPVIEGPMMRETVTEPEVAEGPVLREVSSDKDVVEGPMLIEASTDTEVVEGPVLREVSSDKDVVEGPMLIEASTDTEVVEGPVLREVSSDKDVVEGPMIREAATETEVVEGPVLREPSSDKDVVEGPMLRETATETEVVEGPVLREPSSDKDVAEGPMLREAVTDAEVIEGPTEFTGVKSSDTVQEIDAEPVAEAETGTSPGEPYSWDNTYKSSVGEEQILLDGSYGNNAEIADKDGNTVEPAEAVSLIADSTYIKDVVNGALALEMIIKGSDLKGSKISNDNLINVTATRSYKDELDPLPYDPSSDMGANADGSADGAGYKLTFVPQNVPTNIEDEKYYTIWALLTGVDPPGGNDTQTGALPIGTYTISSGIFSEAVIKDGTDVPKFTNLNADGNTKNYTHDHFPDSVINVSSSAVESSGSDGVPDEEYLIWDGNTDNSEKNIAGHLEGSGSDGKNITFYLGTTNLSENDKTNKGESKRKNPNTQNEYVKDRLGIIMLSYGDSGLTIEKQVTNTVDAATISNMWVFDIDLTIPDGVDFTPEGHALVWEKDGKVLDQPPDGYPATIDFKFTKDDVDNNHCYTGSISLKSGEKATIKDLPMNARYTVTENRTNQSEGFNDPNDPDLYNTYVDKVTEETADFKSDVITPGASVLFINQFWMNPLPETGGPGVYAIVLCGIMLIAVSFILLLTHHIRRRCRSE